MYVILKSDWSKRRSNPDQSKCLSRIDLRLQILCIREGRTSSSVASPLKTNVCLLTCFAGGNKFSLDGLFGWGSHLSPKMRRSCLGSYWGNQSEIEIPTSLLTERTQDSLKCTIKSRLVYVKFNTDPYFSKRVVDHAENSL